MSLTGAPADSSSSQFLSVPDHEAGWFHILAVGEWLGSLAQSHAGTT